jgi:hypothetical protein
MSLAACKRLVFGAALFGCAALSAFSADHASDSRDVVSSSAPAGASVLWNGQDLSGWSVFLKDPAVEKSSVWSVKDGVLRLTGKPNGYVKTKKTFSNYHLHVEWRWPEKAGNSGVFVHQQDADAIWPMCVECQLAAGAAGDFNANGGSDFDGVVEKGHKRSHIKIPSAEKPTGEWNVFDITCRGDSVEAVVNGTRMNSVQHISVTSGHIGLQLEGAPIEFRNIWLEELKKLEAP